MLRITAPQMQSATYPPAADQNAVLAVSLAVLGISLFVQQSVAGVQYLTFLIGVGLGITLMHAAFGFSGSWRQFIRERDGTGIRAQLMLLGIILGAMLAAALAGKFAPAMKLTRTRVFTAVTGGLLLGYGARLGFGCNIGALVGGITSGSLHGWLWMAAGFCGGITGVRLRIWLKVDKPVEIRS